MALPELIVFLINYAIASWKSKSAKGVSPFPKIEQHIYHIYTGTFVAISRRWLKLQLGQIGSVGQANGAQSSARFGCTWQPEMGNRLTVTCCWPHSSRAIRHGSMGPLS